MTLDEFAKQRGLSRNMLANYGVRIAGPNEYLPGWVAFDYPHLTGIWHTRFRNPEANDGRRWMVEPGTGTHLYNPTLAGPDASEIWFTEGEVDTLTLAALGLRAIGLPGAALGSSFRREWKFLFDGAFIVVAFDNDEAGQEAAKKVKHAFEPQSALFLPPEGMDINDWWLDDPDGLRQAIYEFRLEHKLV